MRYPKVVLWQSMKLLPVISGRISVPVGKIMLWPAPSLRWKNSYSTQHLFGLCQLVETES